MQNDESLRKEKLLIIKYLSEFIIENKIEIAESAQEYIKYIIDYVFYYSLEGLQEALQIYHKILKHQGSTIRLECSKHHCIECYEYFIRSDFNRDLIKCTCGNSIIPRVQYLIQNEYQRIQQLRKTCNFCSCTKDKMSFCVIDQHRECKICNDCIRTNFQFFRKDNRCMCCDQGYDDECTQIIRSVLAPYQDANELERFYAKICDICRNPKDSRDFLQICENGHSCCYACKEYLINNDIKKCLGGNNDGQCTMDISVRLERPKELKNEVKQPPDPFARASRMINPPNPFARTSGINNPQVLNVPAPQINIPPSLLNRFK